MFNPHYRQAQRDAQSRRRVALLMGVSVVIHLGFFLILPYLLGSSQDDSQSKVSPSDSSVQVRFMSSDDVQRMFKQANAQKQKKRKKKEPKEEEPPKPKTDQEKPYRPDDSLVKKPDVQPEKANYSGRQASKVAKEQIKRGRPGSTPTPRPTAQAIPQPDQPAQKIPNPKPTPQKAPQKTPKDAKEASTLKLPQNSEASKPSIVINKGSEKQSSASPPTPSASKAQALFAPQVAPSIINEMGENGTFNALEDIPDGEKTELNRVKSRYWVFWDRFTRQVRRHWNPVGELRKRDPYGNVYGVGAFQTLVKITLRSDGSIQKVHIEQPSDHSFLDDEAVRALNAAAPFPNPPEGLKDEDGLIHVRFGFVLELVSGEFRLFRMRPNRPF